MYSSTSLTVYLLEPLTSILLFQIVQNLYWQPIKDQFYVWMPFLILNALFWYGILALWRKKQYKFSLEWFLGKAKEKMKIRTKSSQ